MVSPVMSSILISLITFIITVPLSALALFFAAKIFKVDVSYKNALLPALIVAGVGFVLKLIGAFAGSLIVIGVIGVLGFFISIALYLILPKYIYHLEWKEGLLVGVVWFGFMLVVGFILGIIIGVIAVIVGLGMTFV
ncbi:hypothetical protein HOC35_04855 [Candidatus Woesearchaeota archaeon]|jgi:hypothetical protein|nr:hypothetical protein [Candidatus Woesearchaeota archaeon]